MTARSLARLTLFAALAGVSLGASGCVSLFPKSKPAQLYRFDYAGPEAQPCAQAGETGVIVTPPLFPRESQGDQILSVTGSQTAYIAESRWVSPASNLFLDAVEHAFQGSCAVRLVRRQDFGAGVATLRLDVDRFEAEYPAPGGAPTVKVTFKATLLKRGGDFAAEQFFTGAQAAADNRVGPIVTAYDAATTQALTALRTWTESNAARVAAQEAAADSARGLSPPSPPMRALASPAGARTLERRIAP